MDAESEITTDSENEEEEELWIAHRPELHSNRHVGDAFCRYQGSFLFNLAKMLNEASITGIECCIKWHPKLCNALQVHWPIFEKRYDQLSPILVKYKICRSKNDVKCARASWNRKLREWEFEMLSLGSPWVVYIYKNTNFTRGSQNCELPTSRRH